MSKNDTTIQIRIDSKTKKKASQVLDDMGLDMSSAITLFLNKVIMTETIPFQIRTPNGFTLEYEKQILKEALDTTGDKTFDSTEELIADLENSDEV